MVRCATIWIGQLSGQPVAQIALAALSGPTQGMQSKPHESAWIRTASANTGRNTGKYPRRPGGQERAGVAAGAVERLGDHQAAEDEEHLHGGIAMRDESLDPPGRTANGAMWPSNT